MAKLTDQEIITFYEQRKKNLSQELNKVDAVLKALTSGGNTGASTAKKRKYTRRASAVLKSPAPKADKAPAQPKRTAPKKSAASSGAAAGANGSWDSRIRQALGELGTATKGNIVQFIADRDPATTPERINKALTLRLAVLQKNGKLKGEQAGEQYQYRLSQ